MDYTHTQDRINYLQKSIVYEPPHDKTNNVVVRPAKTQISLGIRPVWSESSLSAWRKLGSLAVKNTRIAVWAISVHPWIPI